MKRASYPVLYYSFILFLLLCFYSLFFPHQALASFQIESKWGEIPSRPGKPLLLTVSIHWTGEADRYAIGSPELDLPEGISKEGISSSSFSRGDETYLVYAIKLSAHTHGSFGPIPISLSIYEKDEKEPSPMVIKTDPFTLDYPRCIRYLIPAGLLAIALLVTGILWRILASKKKRPPSVDLEGPKGQELWNLLARGRAFLVRGEVLSFLKTILTIERSLQDKEQHTFSWLEKLIETVQYAGHRPPPEELERMYRGLKVRLQQQYPQQNNNEKELEASP